MKGRISRTRPASDRDDQHHHHHHHHQQQQQQQRHHHRHHQHQHRYRQNRDRGRSSGGTTCSRHTTVTTGGRRVYDLQHRHEHQRDGDDDGVPRLCCRSPVLAAVRTVPGHRAGV